MGKAFGMMACTTLVAAGLWITNVGDTPSRAVAGVEYAPSQRTVTNYSPTTGLYPAAGNSSSPSTPYRPGTAIRGQSPDPRDTTLSVTPKGPIPFDSPAKRQAVDLLKSARREIQAGNFDIARKKAMEAQQLGAKYAVFEDKPQLVLNEVERRSGALTFSPQPAANQVVTAAGQSPATGQQPIQRTNYSDGFSAETAAPKDQALTLLREARQEMQAGRLAAAREKALMAQSYEVTYGLFDDSPALLLDDLSRMATQVPNSATAAMNSETQVAKGLVKNAREALMSGRYDEAYQQAVNAQKIPATYGVLEDRPEAILKDLELAMAGQASQPTGNIAATAPQGPATSTASTTDETRARELVRQARVAMQTGNMDEAFAKAAAASQLNVAFNLLEDTPDLILSQIEQLQTGAQPTPTTRQTAANLPSAPSFDPNQNPSASAKRLIQEARQAMQSGQYQVARQKAIQADQLAVTYGPFDDRPELVLGDLAQMQATPGSPIASVGFNSQPQAAPVTTAQNVTPVYPADMSAQQMYDVGLSHLTSGNQPAAREAFLMAYRNQEQLDPRRRQSLQDFLRELSPQKNASGIQLVNSREIGAAQSGPLDLVGQQRAIQYDRLRSEVMNAIFRAERLKEKDPDQALSVLDQALANVESTDLGDDAAKNLVNSIRRTQTSVASYKEQQAPLLDMKRRNQETLSAVENKIAIEIRIEQELATLVEQYNDLMDERRYAEAEVIAKQAVELAPENPVAVIMEYKALYARQNAFNVQLKRDKDESFTSALNSVDRSSVIPFKNGDSIAMLDAKAWKDLTDRRSQFGGPDNRVRTEVEQKIEDSLSRPISLHFENAPLTEVMKHIAQLMGITVYVEVPALAEVMVESNTPVSIDVDGIMLKSALNLILAPMELGYNIEDEVLKITNRLRQQGKLRTVVYPVADLVIPLKEITPNENLLTKNIMNLGQNGPGGQLNVTGAHPLLDLGAIGGLSQLQVMDDGSAPGQQAAPFGASPSGTQQPTTTRTNFEELSDLISRTVEPDSWQEFNGAGSLSNSESTLSLVIRQTQEVHDQIADLLGQLRRLQDLQVTIEVRFITVTDSFFERIGVDFDFNIQDTVSGEAGNLPPFGSPGAPAPAANGGSTGTFTQLNPFLTPQDHWSSPTVVGLTDGNGTFTNDLDVGFRQGSFDIGVPDFGGFQPTAGAQVGLAILSDIEAFFFIQAAQGDSRSNVMFAPKVTLFNGQNANVQDITTRPFVLGFTPIVGAGAVGFAPDIQSIPEGITMSVAAVISADRRYVRLSAIPQFSTITDVATFSIPGGSVINVGDVTNVNNGSANAGTTTVTVQQPIIDFLSVTTVVSVPDGGTVLLGGIKRLSEGRNMAGVPILNKLPYVSRLFKNSGVGRDTSSVMLMVTPRIIIQEEEEMLLGLPQ